MNLSVQCQLDELNSETQARWQEFRNAIEEAAVVGSEELERVSDSLLTLWHYSQYSAEWLSRRPEILAELLQGGVETEPNTTERLSQRLDQDFAESPADEASLMQRLRQVRHRENIRIAWRDLNGLADIPETLNATSSLASQLIDRALSWLYPQVSEQMGQPLDSEGKPQQLVILGMGKLGGGELNFSSDIDLIFAFRERGETDHAKPKDNSVFFTRLGQRLINVLNKLTVDGFVYRVDMRLRPFGDSGALVTNFDAMESYYEAHGREWERYAMLKAAPVAGDFEAGRELLERLSGFIYRRYLDYGVLEHLREMKSLIARQALKKGSEGNVKLGPGGIREIEFSTQVFQLISGGQDKRLQEQSLFKSLNYIAEKGMLEQNVVDELLASYVYLRRVENRLQMAADQQTHVLPETDDAQLRLARSMGHSDWATFSEELAAYRQQALTHFNAIFAEQGREEDDVDELTSSCEELWHCALEGKKVSIEIAGKPFDVAEGLSEKLVDFTLAVKKMGISQLGLERLDRVMQLLMPELISSEDTLQATDRLLALLKSVARRPAYFSMLSEHPHALSQLVLLCESSQWISDQLVQFPILLDELLDPLERTQLMTRESLAEALDKEFDQIDADDEELVLNTFRHFKNRQVLRVAATDVMGIFPVMKVSDQLTWIAEVLLDKALEMAWNKLVKRHGQPRCEVEGEWRYPQLGLVAYGKLGGIELGYGSDLDIVFFHDSEGTKQYTDGDKQLDNATFFARMVQRLVNIMTVFTSAGTVYEIDLRLRPSGNSGLLVTTLDGFRKYQENSAWTWEHQALVRARYVSGPSELGDAYRAVREEILSQSRNKEELAVEVREMREKMWKEHGVLNDTEFDLKKSPGGITDIEFMVQYMVLAFAAEHPELCRWTDNVRILQSLAEVGVLNAEQAEILEECYRIFRDEIHHLKLKGESSKVPGDRFVQQRSFVKECWNEFLA